MNLKSKLIAGLGAAALAASMVPVMALGAADTQISVTGLDAGDETAVYYQIVKQNPTTNAWELNGTYGSLTIDNILDGITAEEAGIIADNVSGSGTAMTVSEGTATASNVAPGTYLVIVTPSDNATIYAPIFVSADYDQSASSPNTINASQSSLPTPPMAVAKKTTENVTKTATGSTLDNDNGTGNVAVGSVVDFKVETTVPSYTSNVVNPTFTVSDTVSNGLTINTTSVKVKVGSGSEQAVENGGFYKVAGGEASESDYDFKVSALSASTWKIEFSENYLTKVATGNPAVVVTYKAEVTIDAVKNVNELTNEAEIEYTHTPDGTTAGDEDDTHHYTYSFDVPVAGSDQENSEEFVKIAVDAEGNAVLDKKVTYGDRVVSPLAGAVFTLTGVDNDQTYDSTESNGDGLFSFKGLDAGKYTLKEKTAPAGYQLNPKTYYVEIIPVFNEDGTLKSYTVTCGDKSSYDNPVVSSFSISYDNDAIVADKGDSDIPALFENVQSPVLPTTGGPGTLALTAGGVLLIAAGALAIVRRRSQA